MCRELLCRALQHKNVSCLECVVYKFVAFCLLTIRSPFCYAHIVIYKQRD